MHRIVSRQPHQQWTQGVLNDENSLVPAVAPAYCKRPVGAFPSFRRRAGRRRRDSRAALVGVADMGRGSGGQGLSNSASRSESAVTAYSARQPVNIQDLQLGRNGKDPVSVKNFLQINKVDTSQQNVSAKFDVLVFPFLDVYALLGYTTGTTAWTHPDSRGSHPWHHRTAGTSAQCLVLWTDLRRRCDAAGRGQGQRLAGPDGYRGGRLEPHPDRPVVQERNVDRQHEADRDGLLGQSGPARHGRSFQRGGDLDRCDASEDPANGRRQTLPTQTSNSSCSSRRCNRGTRCSAASSSSARTAMYFSREASASACRSSRRLCTGSDRLIFRARQREDSDNYRGSCGPFP